MAFDIFDTDPVSTPGLVFSGGDLIVQGGGPSLSQSAVAQILEGKKSGKWYVEASCLAASGNLDGVGLLTSWGICAGNVGGNFIGCVVGHAPNTENGWGYYQNDHVVNGGFLVSAVNNTTWNAGSIIGMAVDLDNALWWPRNSAGAWIGPSGTPDPATATDGFDISVLLTGDCRVYPALNLSGPLAHFSLNTGGASFAFTPPAGFIAGWTNTTAGTYFGTFASTGIGNVLFDVAPTGVKTASRWQAAYSGEITSCIFCFSFFNTSGGNLKAAIYADAGGAPGALLGVSINVVASGQYGESVFAFNHVPCVEDVYYWFALFNSSPSGVAEAYSSPLANGLAFDTGSYASPENPFGSASFATGRNPLLVFATPSAGASVGWVSTSR